MHRLRKAFLLLGLALWPAATALAESAATPPPHPGLDAFLRARILESRGLYREAVMAYEQAVASEPQVAEIRVRFASLLVDLGMADRAVEVLAPVEQLDWFGKRVLGLALAMSSARDSTRLPQAEATLRAALAEREDDPNMQLSLAQVVHRQGRTAEAEELVARLRRNRGGSPQLAAFHAGLLRQLGRPQEAVEVYAECAAAEFTGGVDCRESLVELLVELGRPAEAGEAMLGWLTDRDLDQLLRAATLLYEGGRPGEALQTVQRVLRVAPDSPRARDLEAFLLAELGRWGEATPRLQELQRKDRHNLDILLALAWATANTGDEAEARQWIERAWELVQEDAASGQAVRVALSAARVELVAGSSRQAREWLDRVEDPGESGSELAFLLAQSYRKDREWEEGVSALLRLQPRLHGQAQLDARAYEAEFRLRLGDERGVAMLRPLLDSDDRRSVLAGLAVLQSVERWDAVAAEAQRASERLPGDRDVVFTRAGALERLGRFDEAEPLFLELLARDPGDAASANYLGYAWADRGTRLPEALELITRAVTAEPENGAYLDSLGWVYYRLSDLGQAEHWLRRAVELGATDGTVLSHLGEVLLRKGAIDEARTLLRQSLDAGCEHPEHVRELLDGLDGVR
jgi:tetratricopeptide (TPR) repeat protein